MVDESLVDLQTIDLIKSKRSFRRDNDYDVEEALILDDRELEEEKEIGGFVEKRSTG